MKPFRMSQVRLRSKTVPCALAISLIASHAFSEEDCSPHDDWNADTVYNGSTVVYNDGLYRNKWWSKGDIPDASDDPWYVWTFIGPCIDDNIPPTVSFVSPTEGSTVAINSAVNLNVNAQDQDGVIASTQFSVNGSAISGSTWNATQRGLNTIKVTVTDNDDAIAESEISVTVNNPSNTAPTTSITSLAGDFNGQFEENETLIVRASASDSDADDSISRVALLVDGQEVDSTSSMSGGAYELNWTMQGQSAHSIQTVAYDSWNEMGSSASQSITVVAGNQAPTVTVSGPSQVDSGASATFTANAADTDGSVAMVQFYVDGAIVGSDSSAPFQINWTAPADKNGEVFVNAMAYDNRNMAGRSNDIEVYVGQMPEDHNECRPQGLLGDSLYCDVYDTDGREKMGADHPRRIIGYFTSWRNGANGFPTYLVNDIPWDKLTHINYAFAHIGPDKKISIGNTSDPANPATGMTWPGVEGAEMDPSLSYQGHFNLLTKYKKMYPRVKTLISVGGWAETGGYFDDTDGGKRVADGGFYTLTDSQANMEIFADSVVEFLRMYNFDGADIDYEYATSQNDAGNPDDFMFSNPRRAQLYEGYHVLMKLLRDKLDAAGKQDGKHYLLTVAAPGSGWLLRGQETYDVVRYLDYLNMMTYDLHGAWNKFVGPNAPLFDNGKDAEIDFWNIYDTKEYAGIGYLNTDWAYHYYRGSMPPGRINVGIPYYTRGWQGVTGGENGHQGESVLPVQSECLPGTGTGKVPCGWGAEGIDNMWHDLDADGNEIVAGVNPMWHTKNLENGIQGSYLESWGLTPATDPSDTLTGNYERFYDDVAVAPWLWNAEKQVYLASEDEESMQTKVDYIKDRGIGGIMFWELAGDFDWHAERNNGQGEYYFGTTMTSIAYDGFRDATPYDASLADHEMPAMVLDIDVKFTDFPAGDNNYPINPNFYITNNSNIDIPEGSTFEFDVATSTSSEVLNQNGLGIEIITDGSNASGNNIGGLDNNFHRASFTLKQGMSIPVGSTWQESMKWYNPISTPSNWTVSINGQVYGFKFENMKGKDETWCDRPENQDLPECNIPDPNSCEAKGIDITSANTYPNWPQTDWQGNPNHATSGDLMIHNGAVWRCKWWTTSAPAEGGPWERMCNVPAE